LIGRTIIVSRNGTPVGVLRPIKRRHFVPRAVIADAAGKTARIDAAQFRADLDAVVDPHPLLGQVAVFCTSVLIDHDQIMADELPDESG